MASEDTEALIDTLNILNAQQQMAAAGADTGNPRTKGVVVDKKAGSKARAVSPTLTSNEKSRYESIFKILKNVIDPGPEAGKSSTTSRVKKEASVSGAAKEITEGDAKKQGTSFIDKLLAGLGILTFAKQIFGYLKKKLFGLLGKMGTFLKKSFLAAFKTAKKVLSNIGRTILKAFRNAGAAIGKVFDKLKNSKAVQALKGAIGAAFTRLKDVFMGAKNALLKNVNKLKNLIKPAAAAGAGGTVGASGAAGQPAKPSLFSRLKSGVKSFGSKVVTGTVNVAKATGGAIKSGATNVYKGVKAVGGALLGKGKKLATGAMNTVLKGGKGVLKVLSKFAKLPIIGPVIEGFLIKNDLENLQEQAAAGEITPEELETKAGRRVMTGVTALGGAALGGIAGSLIPIPIIGTLAGAVAGDLLGRLVGGVIADTLLDPYKRDVGRFALNRMGGVPEVDDGVIMHGGKTVRINSKDDVLALKTGGPLDSMFKSKDSSGIQDAAVFNDIKSVNIAQLQILTSIRDGIMALGRTSQASSASSGPSTVNLKPNLATIEYYA